MNRFYRASPTLAALLATRRLLASYAAIASAAAQQTEIGIRDALRASPGTVTGMFVHRGVVLSGVGVVVSLVLIAAAALVDRRIGLERVFRAPEQLEAPSLATAWSP